MMIDYMGPSLIPRFTVSSGVWLFANHPAQWDTVVNHLTCSACCR